MTIIEKLEKELKQAEKLEELSLRDYREDEGDEVKTLAYYAKAQGYTNGILEAIEIARLHKETK